MARFIQNEDCQGRPSHYYQAERIDSTGRYILANAETPIEAEALVESRLNDREMFLQQSNQTQLRQLVGKQRMSPNEMEDAIKLMAAILFEGECK